MEKPTNILEKPNILVKKSTILVEKHTILVLWPTIIVGNYTILVGKPYIIVKKLIFRKPSIFVEWANYTSSKIHYSKEKTKYYRGDIHLNRKTSTPLL